METLYVRLLPQDWSVHFANAVQPPPERGGDEEEGGGGGGEEKALMEVRILFIIHFEDDG